MNVALIKSIIEHLEKKKQSMETNAADTMEDSSYFRLVGGAETLEEVIQELWDMLP